MTSEWDNTPWAGTPAPSPRRPAPVLTKSVTALGPWQSGTPLASRFHTPGDRIRAYLRAYRVGWFHKAGRKIANDIAALDWSVSDGDAEEGEAEATLARPPLSIPFDRLPPIDQFQRLLERPNAVQKTGRELLRKTQIHLDFAGVACWYLENGEGGRLPTGLMTINPARMQPARDRAGRLIGWVMDLDSARPVTFEPDEILWFSTGNADEDDDIWGTSVVEAVYSQVPLTDMMARHTANVLTTGGRLAGMMWPKERALTEAEYVEAQRAWRNVATDPDAGKRLLIFPEPMEYAAGASTPAEIGIPELATLNRDEILTAFQLNPHMLGVPLATGMNSGETMRHVRREYWEGVIHPRADLIEETIQVGLLARYEEASGTTYDFELAEPNLDDAPVLLERVEAFRALVSAGFDEREAVKAAGLGHITFVGRPEPPPALVAPPQEPQPPQEPPPATRSAKATREELLEDLEREMRDIMVAYLAEQRERLIERISEVYPRSKSARKALPESWWDPDEEAAAITRAIGQLTVRLGRSAAQVVADRLGRVVMPNQIAAITRAVLAVQGERIGLISETTRRAVMDLLAEGVRRGYSLPQLIDGVPDEGFGGLRALTLDNGTPAFGELRAETIARTETAQAMNTANLIGYREFGVTEVRAMDGDEDEECASRDGQTFALDDALGVSDHPNGTLDWVPIVPAA